MVSYCCWNKPRVALGCAGRVGEAKCVREGRPGHLMCCSGLSGRELLLMHSRGVQQYDQGLGL